MKRALLCGALLLLALPTAASAGGPPGSIPFSFKMPAKGHETVYGVQVTGHLPAGTTMSGGVPVTVSATNRSQIGKGVLSAAVVVPIGTLKWDVFVVVDATKETGSGTTAITGNISLPPLPDLTETESPAGPPECKELLKAMHGLVNGHYGGMHNVAMLFWVFTGPTASARSTIRDGKCL